MNSIKDEINKYHIKKIFGNSVNKIEFILQKTNELDIPQVFEMPKSKITTSMLDKWIIKNWDYEKDLKTIRLLYKRTQKYLNGKNATHQILEIRNSFNDAFPYLKLKWPCNQAKFDDLVQRINKESIIREQKIEKVIDAAVQFYH